MNNLNNNNIEAVHFQNVTNMSELELIESSELYDVSAVVINGNKTARTPFDTKVDTSILKGIIEMKGWKDE